MRAIPIVLATLLLAAATLAGCRSGAFEVAGRGEHILADDGFGLTAFRFEQKGAPAGPPRATVMYLQGSDDRSVTSAIGALAAFCAMNAPVIAVERRGVSPDGSVDAAVAAHYATRDRRIADALTTLEWGTANTTDKPIALLGASEGADVAAAVAARSPRVTHVILLGGGGGWTQADEFRHFLRKHGAYMGLASERELDERIADIRAHPDADTMWAGHPYRRWSTYMFSRIGDDLRKVTCPILLVHGSADDSVPVESARALRDEFARAGKTNLRLVEIPDADHGFHDAKTGKDKLALVETAVVKWLAEQSVLDQREAAEYDRRVRAKHPDVFE